MEKEWSELTPEEKKAERFRRWLEIPDNIQFVDDEAKERYKKRMQRFADAYLMKEPDRVPVQLPFGDLPLKWEGISLHKAMYDYDLIADVWSRFIKEWHHVMDSFSGPGMVLPGKVYDLIDYRLYKYPGHGLPETAQDFQFAEGEYMMANEYDAMILNPSDFWMRTYMPRIFGSLEAFRGLSPFTNIIELPASYFMPFGRDDVQAALQSMIDAGNELKKWGAAMGKCTLEAQALGVPAPRGGGLAKAPFDTLGDTLRGTLGIFKDMYRQPSKVHEAMDVVTELTIQSAINTVNATNGIMVGFPLHKGADGFMSDKQFDEFYWPSLKKVCDALIEEGIIPSLFAEGSYLTRLEKVNVFPKGAIHWRFDQTDMKKAKEVLGDNCSLAGNVPASVISTGDPSTVREYCKRLLDDCAPGGGYILSSGASVTMAPKENIRAMAEAVEEFGYY